MEFSIKLHTMAHCIYRWVIFYNINVYTVFFSLKNICVLANSTDPYEMSHNAAFHLSNDPLHLDYSGLQTDKGLYMSDIQNLERIYIKTCVKRHLSKRLKSGFQDQLSLNAGKK